MSLAAGSAVGPYLIESSLGVGGMGEVYRARDTRLDRIVAIKVLMGSLAADSESRQRFEQEARAIAALNDPHICTIHDVGRHDDVDYLVLEYLEGETLADRLGRSPLSTSEALPIAIQIGDALDHAHRAGIVHRDLKPGNVMLVRRSGATSETPDVKLLDFGLAARVATGRPRIVDAALSETIAPSQEATQLAAPVATGFSGTVQYMAPEQIGGDAGDHRADIFAFGCVLYEMFAGRKAFEGANAMTVIAALTSTDPAPIPALQQSDPHLDHVMRRCLEKDRERRWQSISDVTGELRWIASRPAPSASAVAVRSRSWPLTAAVAVAALVLGAAGAIALRGRTSAPQLPTLRLELTTPPTDDPSVALSPDGRQVAFVANQNQSPVLWVRALDGNDNRALAGSAGATLPFWSPDGQTIAFFAENKLKRIDVANGTVLVIADAPNARGGTWNREGVILFGPGPNGAIVRVPARGGPIQSVTTPNAATGPSHHWPEFLPDGKRFLFTSRLGTADTNGVYIGTLEPNTAPTRLLPGDNSGRFVAPDRLLTIRQGALQAYKFDLASDAIQGEPTVIAQGFATASATAVFATSDSGVLAYRVGTAQRRQLVWMDRGGVVLRSIGDPASDFIAAPELSADERSVLVFRQPTGDNDIWLIELERNIGRRITDGPPADSSPLWDPNGQYAVFFSRRFGGGGPAKQALAGGRAEPLFANSESGTPLSWGHGRSYVLVRRTGAGGGPDLVAVSTAAEREVPVASSPADETEGQFSPDGHWVAFVSNESGRPEVFAQSFPEGRGRVQVSPAGGAQVRWSKAGNKAGSQEIFYIAPDGKMMAASISFRGGAADVKLPVALFQTHLANGTNVLGVKPQYDVARDGRFLLNTAIESAAAPILVSVNWMKSLNK